MISSYTLGRFFAGVTLLTLPALLLVPGCGGGSGSSPTVAFQNVVGVELIDNSDATKPVVFDRGNLTVGITDASSPNKTASGTLQLLGTSAIVPTPTATQPGVTPAPTPVLPSTGAINLRPSPGTYVLTGTATFTGSNAPFGINLRGAFQKELPFTLSGNLDAGSVLVLRVAAKSGSIVIPMRVVEKPFAFSHVVPTPIATTGVPVATASATPSGTATATGTPTGTPTATTVATPTTTVPTSPVGTPISPVGTPVSPTTPF